ncbi:MAG TPA: MFS transporter [Candidatus Limnocylindrales bacterium]|nr:MFS transporter [Candidatus Limnocylindrales bacterium]
MRDGRNGQLLLIGGGLLAFTMIGWTGLVVPSLIREIQRDLVVNDADMGLAYGVFTAMFLAGCLVTGWAVSRTGRRPLLLGAIAILFLGTVGALVPVWPVFLLAGALRGFGSGMIEVGIQGLFLAAFTGAIQGRAINSVHFAYSVGAVIAPLAMAALVGLGLAWTGAMALAAVPIAIAGVMLALAPIEGAPDRASGPSVRLRVTVPLVAAGLSIACYVAAEVGVSSWLVRFLADVDLALAATALTLFWVSLAASRLVVARFGHHVPPEALGLAGFLVAAFALVAAVVVPSTAGSIALFALTGFVLGPVYPGIILVGGRISLVHKDAVTSLLASAGVAGAVIYPPLMGAISLDAGLGVAIAGAGLLCAAGAGFLAITVRRLGPATGAAPAGAPAG